MMREYRIDGIPVVDAEGKPVALIDVQGPGGAEGD